MTDVQSLVIAGLGVATILGLLGMGVNGVRLLKGFKNGILAKGWKFISLAAFFFIYGISALDLSISGWIPLGVFAGVLGFSGALFQAIAALTFAYGCKAQYDAWNPKGMTKSSSVVVQSQTGS